MVNDTMQGKEVTHGFVEVCLKNQVTGAVVKVEQPVRITDERVMYVTLPICSVTDKFKVSDFVRVKVRLDGEPYTTIDGFIEGYDFPDFFTIRLEVKVAEAI
jgi:hypothetical protein